MDGIENYRGREQSYIKHQFLTQYLQIAAFKILQARTPVFNFVDGFAGPWRATDEKDYSDTSFDQVLQTLEKIRLNLQERMPELKMRICLCEKDKKATKKLLKYAQSNKHFDIHVIQGSFEDHLNEIELFCRNGFTFTFIDPTGWNIDSKSILQFFKRQKEGEFILNFMAEHINRHAEYPPIAKSLGRFLADPEWEDQFHNLSSEWNNERRILHLLKKRIKETKSATYVPDFPILKPTDKRIKMRLLLGTRSSEGLVVFRDIQEKIEPLAIRIQHQLRNEKSPQDTLFNADETVNVEMENDGIGCLKYKREAEKRIVDLLTETPSLSFKKITINILEFIPIRRTHLNILVGKMKKENVINYDLPPRKRTPQEDTLISLAG